MSEATEESLMQASSGSFSSLWISRVRSRVMTVAGPGQVAQFTDRRRRHERGSDQPVGAQIREPSSVGDIGFAARDVSGITGVDQDDVQFLVLEQVVEGTPVITGCFHHHQTHPLRQQVFLQVQDLSGHRTPRGDRRRGCPGPRPWTRIQTFASFFEISIPAHRGCITSISDHTSQSSCRNQGACVPGKADKTTNLTFVLKATIHGPADNKAVPPPPN